MRGTDRVMKTKISPHHSKLTWSIKNARKLSQLKWSEKFSLLPNCKTVLRGAVNVIKHSAYNLDLSIGLQRIDCCKNDITINTTLKMCNSLGEIYASRADEFKMNSKDKNIHWCVDGRFAKFGNFKTDVAQQKCPKIPSEDSDGSMMETDCSLFSGSIGESVGYLKGDELLIKGNIKIYGCCNVSHSKTLISTNDLKETQSSEESLHEIINDLKLAYESNFDTDIVLNVDGFEIRAHKFILCVRCPYFRRIISDDENTNYIKIDDMNKRVFEAFLRFLYTGAVGAVQLDTIKKLYTIAEKYEVDYLKKNCSLVMKPQIDNINACDILVLANDYKDVDLKRCALNFITDNFEEAEIRKNFSALLKNHAELANVVMHFKSSKLP